MLALNEVFEYNSLNGEIRWKINPKCRHANIGDIAGTTNQKDGYIRIRHKGNNYKAHRLAWYLYYGSWPIVIDHINRIRHDNRIENLREVSKADNSRNRNKPSKYGTNIYKNGKGYVVQFKGKNFGTYHTLDDAIIARDDYITYGA